MNTISASPHLCGFFSNDARIAKLLYVAGLWEGTPWRENSESRGERGGVACHNLPRAIYRECAAFNLPPVVGDPRHSRQLGAKSVMVEFLDGRPEFQRIEISQIQPGDLLGFKLCHCVDHLGVALNGQNFAHVLMHKKTQLDDRYTVPPWSQMLRAAWRPLEI